MDGARLSLALATVAAGVLGCNKADAPPVATKSISQLAEEAVGESEVDRSAAITALTDRESDQAVEVLVARLRDPDPDVVARSIEALVALGDPAAVSGLIELSREDRPALALRAVVAIGQIGGRDAEGYLFTLETGAEEEAVRRTAGESRMQLRRKRAAKSAAASAPPEGTER